MTSLHTGFPFSGCGCIIIGCRPALVPTSPGFPVPKSDGRCLVPLALLVSYPHTGYPTSSLLTDLPDPSCPPVCWPAWYLSVSVCLFASVLALCPLTCLSCLSACLSAILPAIVLACLPACLSTSLPVSRPACRLACLPASLHTGLPAYLPVSQPAS